MGAQRNLVFLITAVVLFVLYLRRPPVPDLNADDADFSSDDNVAGDSETNAQRTQAIRARTPVRSKHRPAARPGSAQPSRSEDGVDAALRQAEALVKRRWSEEKSASGLDGEVDMAEGEMKLEAKEFSQEFGVDEELIRQALASDRSSKNGARGVGGKHARGTDSLFDKRAKAQSELPAGLDGDGGGGEDKGEVVLAAEEVQKFILVDDVVDEQEGSKEESAAATRAVPAASTLAVNAKPSASASSKRASKPAVAATSTATAARRAGASRASTDRSVSTSPPTTRARASSSASSSTSSSSSSAFSSSSASASENDVADATATQSNNRTALRRHKLRPDMFDRDGNIRDSYYLNHLPGRLEWTRCPGYRGERPALGTDTIVYMPRSMGGVEDSFVHSGNYANFFRRKTPPAFTAQHIPEDMHEVFHKYKFRSCAIVGNSGDLLRSQFGKSIDSHDVVIRLNQAPIQGYEKHVGHKSTFRLLNALWSHRYCTARDASKLVMQYGPELPNWVTEHGMGDFNRPIDGDKLPLEKGCALLSSRADEKQYEQLASFWTRRNNDRSHGKKKDASGNGGRDKDVRVFLLSSRLVSLTRAMLVRYRAKLCKAGFGPFEGGNDPTSGLLAVVASLNWCRAITAYGFGESFGSTNTLLGMSSPYHYYKFYGMRDKGNVGAHAFEAESMLMQELLDSDRVHPPEGHPWHLKDRGQHAYYRHNLRICHSYDSERGPDNSKGWCRAPGVSLPQPSTKQPWWINNSH